MGNTRALSALLALGLIAAGCDSPRTADDGGTADSGDTDAGGDVCDGRANPCATAGTSCSGDTLVECAPDADGCLVETRTDCGASGRVCDESGATAACVDVDPCAGIPAEDQCTTEGDRACDGDTLEVCTMNADGCLVLERTECAASPGGLCGMGEEMLQCLLPPDPCAGVPNACTTAGTSCSGDSLVECAPNAFGCLVETTTDCTTRAGGTCDASGATATCVVPGDPCEGITQCATPGTSCDGPDLVECAPDAFGCLVETRTRCSDTMFGFCDADASPPACSTAASDPCMGVTECGTEPSRTCADASTLETCAPNAFGCYVSTTTDCSATSEVCDTSSGTALCVDPCSLVTVCPDTEYCDGADRVICEGDTNGCLVETMRTTCGTGLVCASTGTGGTTCVDNAVCAGATPVSASTTITGEDTSTGGPVPTATGCGGSGSLTMGARYYAVTIPPGQFVQVDLAYDASSADLVLFALSDCAAAACDDAEDFISAQEMLVVSNVAGTSSVTTIVGVMPYNSGDDGVYDISFEYITPASAPNATCAGATAVTAPTTISGENTLAGGALPTASDCGGLSTTTGGALYYAVTIPAGQDVQVELAYDTVVADLVLFTLADCAASSCDDSADNFSTPEVLVLSNASGTTDVTRIVGVRPYGEGDDGRYDISFTPFMRSPNATCAGALPVTHVAGTPMVTFTGEDTNLGGARISTSSCLSGGQSDRAHTLYYALTIPPGERVNVELTYGTATDLVVSGYADCAASACLGVVDELPPDAEAFTVSNPEATPFSLVLGVGPYDVGGGGTYDISFTYEAIPAGDVCTAPIPVTASGTYTGTTVGFVNNYQLSSSGCTSFQSSGPDVVYAVTLDAGETLSATLTPDSLFDAALYVVTDCAMAEATCLDGSDVGFEGEPESITYTATAAGTVYVIVDSWHSTVAGTYSLDVTITP